MEASLVLSPGERRLAILKSSVQLLEHVTKAGRLLCSVVQESMALRQLGDGRTPVYLLQVDQVWEDLNPRGKGRRIRLLELDEDTVVAENVKTSAQSTIRRDSFVGKRPRFKLVSDGS